MASVTRQAVADIVVGQAAAVSRRAEEMERAAGQAEDPTGIDVHRIEDLVGIVRPLGQAAAHVAGALADIVELEGQAIAHVVGSGRQQGGRRGVGLHLRVRDALRIGGTRKAGAVAVFLVDGVGLACRRRTGRLLRARR